MKKVVSMVQPFIVNQTIYVYEDGNKVDVVNCDMDNFTDTIIAATEKYNTAKVELVGPKQFSQGLANNIKKAEITKYGKNKLEISLI